MRKVQFQVDYLDNHAASVLSCYGQTKVLCTASVEEYVPFFLKESQKGWLTAEYRMLPCSTHERIKRETKGVSGRTAEIQRLIGRSLRSIVNLGHLTGLTITVDCDVIQADGGTRTAAISGAYIAVHKIVNWLLKCDMIKKSPLLSQVAAVSVGYIKGQRIVDLCYEEDSNADVDCNIVMNSEGKLIEIQGTAEGAPFSVKQLNDMIEGAQEAIQEIFVQQKEVLKL